LSKIFTCLIQSDLQIRNIESTEPTI